MTEEKTTKKKKKFIKVPKHVKMAASTLCTHLMCEVETVRENDEWTLKVVEARRGKLNKWKGIRVVGV